MATLQITHWAKHHQSVPTTHTHTHTVSLLGWSFHVMFYYTPTLNFFITNLWWTKENTHFKSLLVFLASSGCSLVPLLVKEFSWRLDSSLRLSLCVFSSLRNILLLYRCFLYGTCCTVKCSNSHIMRSLSRPSRRRVFGVRTSASRDGGDL